MNDSILISGPVAEPVTLAEVKLQLGFGPMEDYDPIKGLILSETLRPFITAARTQVENDLRRVLLTQRWLYKADGWPGHDAAYSSNRYCEILLPKPPFQSIEFFRYVDTTGTLQDLPLDANYGNDAGAGAYRYQLVPGSETQPARLLPAWATPWPPTRRVPASVQVQFKAGYGGPVTVSMTQASAVLSGPVFNLGDMGQMISVPGAGAAGAQLTSVITAVDGNGQATLMAPAQTAVTDVTAWAGQPVPTPILSAIKFLVQFFYEKGGADDAPLPRVVQMLINPYRNLVS